jgi:hypothetical protein
MGNLIIEEFPMTSYKIGVMTAVCTLSLYATCPVNGIITAYHCTLPDVKKFLHGIRTSSDITCEYTILEGNTSRTYVGYSSFDRYQQHEWGAGSRVKGTCGNCTQDRYFGGCHFKFE